MALAALLLATGCGTSPYAGPVGGRTQPSVTAAPAEASPPPADGLPEATGPDGYRQEILEPLPATLEAYGVSDEGLPDGLLPGGVLVVDSWAGETAWLLLDPPDGGPGVRARITAEDYSTRTPQGNLDYQVRSWLSLREDAAFREAAGDAAYVSFAESQEEPVSFYAYGADPFRLADALYGLEGGAWVPQELLYE